MSRCYADMVYLQQDCPTQGSTEQIIPDLSALAKQKCDSRFAHKINDCKPLILLKNRKHLCIACIPSHLHWAKIPNDRPLGCE